jgi:amino acid adenylation domain-containing protein
MTDALSNAAPTVSSASGPRIPSWDATAPTTPGELVYSVIERRARAHPNALAVAAGGGCLTYGELLRRSEGVAGGLRAAGVGRVSGDVVVPVLADRTAEMVAGMLGVWRAGAAYLPLDPGHPAERLRYMIEDVGAPLVLTQRGYEHLLATGTPRQFLGQPVPLAVPGVPGGEPGPGGQSAPGGRGAADRVAYVIYTSGSTGRPKAVMITHASLTNLFHWYEQVVHPGARVLQFAPFSFDVSLHEAFAAFASDGSLHLPLSDGVVDPWELADFLDEQQITRAVLPPVLLHELAADFADSDRLQSLREIVSTGDLLRLTPAVRQFFALRPECALWNHYGATESQGGTLFVFAENPIGWPDDVPLGEVVTNARIYLVDKRLHRVNHGEIGEVCFAGVGLARGYLGQSGLTAERFVPDPFAVCAGGRLYRTGDLARYRADGVLEYLGRVDHQVKVRGTRIEPGEIESVLTRHPDIRQAVVLARLDDDQAYRLTAFLVAGRRLDPAEVRAYLAGYLPEPMIPGGYVQLEALPVTPNGKLDRAVLAGLAAGLPSGSAGPAAPPRTALEQTLADVWTDVLHRPDIGIHDNFFDIGGDSITAMQVAARVRDLHDVALTVRDLFEWPTIAELAETVDMR